MEHRRELHSTSFGGEEGQGAGGLWQGGVTFGRRQWWEVNPLDIKGLSSFFLQKSKLP